MRDLNVTLLFSECIFCLIAAVSLLLAKNIERDKRFLTTFMFLFGSFMFLSDLHSWMLEDLPGKNIVMVERFATFCTFFLPNAIIALFHTYVFHCIFGDYMKNKKLLLARKRYLLVYHLCTFASLAIVLSQFFDFIYYIEQDGTYKRGTFYFFSYLFAVVCLLIDGSVIYQYREKTSKTIIHSLVTYIVAPIVGIVAQQYVEELSIANISVGISLIIVYVAFLMEQNRIFLRNREEIYETQIDLMLSQVGPHFIYNALTTIKHLCKKDPQLAVETIDEFAAYLRGNLDTLNKREQIPFSQELQHVKNYLSIEKKRFGERVKVEYDIAEEDFLVPALILQPMVENSIKHGITKKPQGGTIKIKTYRTNEKYMIQIEDDGIGFDSQKMKELSELPPEVVTIGSQQIIKRHLGIENVKNRLQAMCGGDLEIDSIPGEKTRVMIWIPINNK